MSFWDNLDGSGLYSADMKSSTDNTKKETAASKTLENNTEALNLYLESDSARLMRNSIEKSTTLETQVEERREKALEEKNYTKIREANTQEKNKESTNQPIASATSTDGILVQNTHNKQSQSKNEKKPVILPSHAKQKGQASKEVAQYWESEAAVDLSTRRQRYRNPYVVAESVPSWDEYSRHLKHIDKAPLFSVDEDINKKVALFSGSVTQMEVDAIVNSTNEACVGGTGVDGDVHTAAGRLLLEECKTLGGCQTGKAKITRGYNLPAKYVIHTAGPKKENDTQMRSCYQSCLQLAEEFEIRTLAFSCISVVNFGYPLAPSTRIALETVRRWLETDDNRNKVDKIIFVLHHDKEKACYEEMMPLYFPTAELMTALEDKHKQTKHKQDEEQKKQLEKEREEKAKLEKLRQEEEQKAAEKKKLEERKHKEVAERKLKESQKLDEDQKKTEETMRLEEENRKKELEKQQQESKRMEAAAKQAPSPVQTQSEVKAIKSESVQGMNPYLLFGGLVGMTIVGVAAFLLFKRR